MAKQILRMREEGVRAELVQRGKARSSHWTSREFAEGVLRIVDEIEPKRRAWR
jgi:hypothetical protein